MSKLFAEDEKLKQVIIDAEAEYLRAEEEFAPGQGRFRKPNPTMPNLTPCANSWDDFSTGHL